MSNCKDCDRYNAETKWCALLNRKKLPDSSCREFVGEDKPAKAPRGVPIATLDALVDWMRKRAVIAIKVNEIAITLGTLEEPMPQPKMPANREPPSEDALRKKKRDEIADIFYPSRHRREE